VLSEIHLRTTGRHLSMCYLPPDRGDRPETLADSDSERFQSQTNRAVQIRFLLFPFGFRF